MDKNSFVFYESFWKVTSGFDDVKFSRLMRALIQYSLYGTAPDLPDETENALVTMMTVNVDAAHERYAKAKEDGAKGGRPKKYIPPDDWQPYYEKHGRKATAEHFGIPEDTLKHWISALGKKGKNLTDTVTDTDTVTVTDTDTDTVTSILINNNSRSRRGASEAPSLPALKEGERWVTEPYVRPDGKVMADYKDASGEVRSMFIG